MTRSEWEWCDLFWKRLYSPVMIVPRMASPPISDAAQTS